MSPRSSPISSHWSVRSLFPFHFHISSKFRQVCNVLKSGMGSFLDGNKILSKNVIGVTSLVHLMYTRSISMQCSGVPVSSVIILREDMVYHHELYLLFLHHALPFLRHNILYPSLFSKSSSSAANEKLQASPSSHRQILQVCNAEVCPVCLIC